MPLVWGGLKCSFSRLRMRQARAKLGQCVADVCLSVCLSVCNCLCMSVYVCVCVCMLEYRGAITQTGRLGDRGKYITQ